jgi:hypothetical protein
MLHARLLHTSNALIEVTALRQPPGSTVANYRDQSDVVILSGHSSQP